MFYGACVQLPLHSSATSHKQKNKFRAELYRLNDRHLSTKFSANFYG
jgi:hypothetical protein